MLTITGPSPSFSSLVLLLLAIARPPRCFLPPFHYPAVTTLLADPPLRYHYLTATAAAAAAAADFVLISTLSLISISERQFYGEIWLSMFVLMTPHGHSDAGARKVDDGQECPSMMTEGRGEKQTHTQTDEQMDGHGYGTTNDRTAGQNELT